MAGPWSHKIRRSNEGHTPHGLGWTTITRKCSSQVVKQYTDRRGMILQAQMTEHDQFSLDRRARHATC
eukprot:660306-Pleurochrysis_carterae.AAC.2